MVSREGKPSPVYKASVIARMWRMDSIKGPRLHHDDLLKSFPSLCEVRKQLLFELSVAVDLIQSNHADLKAIN